MSARRGRARFVAAAAIAICVPAFVRPSPAAAQETTPGVQDAVVRVEVQRSQNGRVSTVAAVGIVLALTPDVRILTARHLFYPRDADPWTFTGVSVAFRFDGIARPSSPLNGDDEGTDALLLRLTAPPSPADLARMRALSPRALDVRDGEPLRLVRPDRASSASPGLAVVNLKHQSNVAQYEYTAPSIVAADEGAAIVDDRGQWVGLHLALAEAATLGVGVRPCKAVESLRAVGHALVDAAAKCGGNAGRELATQAEAFVGDPFRPGRAALFALEAMARDPSPQIYATLHRVVSAGWAEAETTTWSGDVFAVTSANRHAMLIVSIEGARERVCGAPQDCFVAPLPPRSVGPGDVFPIEFVSDDGDVYAHLDSNLAITWARNRRGELAVSAALRRPGATLSANGRAVAFVEDMGQRIGLYSFPEPGAGIAVPAPRGLQLLAPWLSPDGRFLAAALVDAKGDPSGFRMWSLGAGTARLVFSDDTKQHVERMTFAPDASYVYVRHSDIVSLRSSFSVIDLTRSGTGSLLSSGDERRLSKPVSAAALAPGFFATSSDEEVTLWYGGTNNVVATLPRSGGADKMAFSADGQYLAVYFPGLIRVFESRSGRQVAARAATVDDLIFSANRRIIGFSSSGKQLLTWNIRDEGPSPSVDVLRVDRGRAAAVGQRLIALGKRIDGLYVRVADDAFEAAAADAEVLFKLPGFAAADPVWMIAMNPTEDAAAISTPDGRIAVFRVSRNPPRLLSKPDLASNIVANLSGMQVTAMAFDPDGRYLVVATLSSAIVLDGADFKRMRNLPMDGDVSEIKGMAVSRREVAIANAGGVLQRFDLASAQPKPRASVPFDFNRFGVTEVQLVADDACVVSLLDAFHVFCFDSQQHREIAAASVRAWRLVGGASAAESFLFAMSDEEIRIWRMQTRPFAVEDVGRLRLAGKPIAFDVKDSTLVVLFEDGTRTVTIWDPRTLADRACRLAAADDRQSALEELRPYLRGDFPANSCVAAW